MNNRFKIDLINLLDSYDVSIYESEHGYGFTGCESDDIVDEFSAIMLAVEYCMETD